MNESYKHVGVQTDNEQSEAEKLHAKVIQLEMLLASQTKKFRDRIAQLQIEMIELKNIQQGYYQAKNEPQLRPLNTSYAVCLPEDEEPIELYVDLNDLGSFYEINRNHQKKFASVTEGRPYIIRATLEQLKGHQGVTKQLVAEAYDTFVSCQGGTIETTDQDDAIAGVLNIVQAMIDRVR